MRQAYGWQHVPVQITKILLANPYEALLEA
jgi:hypothetical protein